MSDIFPDAWWRGAAVFFIACIAVVWKFGTMALFTVVLCLLAVFGGGFMVVSALMVALWICVGKAKMNVLVNKPSPFVWLGVYLVASAASGLYFYSLMI